MMEFSAVPKLASLQQQQQQQQLFASLVPRFYLLLLALSYLPDGSCLCVLCLALPPPPQHPFCKALKAAEKPLILYGSAVLERDDAASIVKVLKSLNAQTKVWATCVRKRVRQRGVFDTSFRQSGETKRACIPRWLAYVLQ